MKYVLAGFNGLVCATGLFIFTEFLIFRPRRWRTRIIELLRLLDNEENSLDKSQRKELEIELAETRDKLKNWRQDPKTLLQIAFGILMVCISLYSLISINFPSSNPFTG